MAQRALWVILPEPHDFARGNKSLIFLQGYFWKTSGHQIPHSAS